MIILVSLSASCDKRNPPPIIAPIPDPPPPSDLRYITRITASPEFIYSDQNITYSTISVEVKDGEGFGVPGQMVQFMTNLGRVLTNVATDSTGVSKTTFWDDGDVGMATIKAVVRKFHASIADSLVSEAIDSIQVEIKPIPAIADVNLRLPSELSPYPMNVMQTINVVAIPMNTENQTVPNNTLVTFSCTKGRFLDAGGNEIGSSTVASTYNGQAAVRYSSWTDATTTPGTENAFITATIAGASDTKEVLIRPGRPANIDLRSYVQVGDEMIEADTSSVASLNHIYMRAGLTDIYSNNCPTQPVKFTTDLGSFINTTQTVTINTAADGIAQVRFTPGLSAGAATIKALANGDTLQAQTIFNITSDELYSISFTQEDQINLNVANTGGLQSAILRVKLRDINGNLIDRPLDISFKIVNNGAPEGANLNGYPQDDSVTVVSNGGEAQVSVNSGTQSGMLTIRASFFDDGDTPETSDDIYIYSLKTNIVIHAGPPADGGIVPFVGGFNTGVNIGGGMWRVVAGAVVKDIHNNPVDKGTAVWFELLNNPPCQIVAEAYVGNVSVNGDSLAGVAFTIFTYSGIYTYDTVTVRAHCADIYGDADVEIPLNDPRFEIQAQPQSLNFDYTGNPPVDQPNPEYSNIHCYLTDGQGLPIEGAKVMLLSTRGSFVQNVNGIYDPELPANEWWRIITDEEGIALGRIAFMGQEVPPPDPMTGTPGSIDALITGRIMSTNIQANTSVTLYKYLGVAPW